MVDYALYIVIGCGSLTFGAIGTLLTVRRGMISVATCAKCSKAKEDDMNGIKGDLKDFRKESREDIHGIHARLDETNKEIGETNKTLVKLVGYLEGKGERKG